MYKMLPHGKIVLALMVAAQLGCVQSSYRYGTGKHQSFESGFPDRPAHNPVPQSIAYGGNYPRLDRIERSVRAPIDFVKKHVPFIKDKKEVDSPDESRREAVALANRYLQDKGVRVVRGSSYQGGGRAAKKLIDIGKDKDIVITPDGPRGLLRTRTIAS